MKRLVLIGLLMSGCVYSGQIGSPIRKADFDAAISQLQQNDQILAQKIAELAPKPKEVAKK